MTHKPIVMPNGRIYCSYCGVVWPCLAINFQVVQRSQKRKGNR